MSDVGKNPSSTFMEGRSTLGKAGFYWAPPSPYPLLDDDGWDPVRKPFI